jgi:diguanylate cyclase (GGDEF)-like protein/PAS domain S-box-containing protein
MDDIFFKELVGNLAFVTKTKYALISETVDEETPKFIDTVAFLSNGEFVDNIRYSLEGTPCKEVFEGNVCFYSQGVQALFPDDKELIIMDVEGYLGCPIVSSSGHVLGHIAILDTIPLENEQELTAIVQAFATLAGSEFERLKSQQALAVSEEKFSKALEVSPDAVVITNLADGKILEANDACTTMTGYQREELIGKTTLDLNIYGVDERKKIVSRLRKEGKYANFESILRRKDGKVLNTLSSAVVLEIKGESCVFGIIHDITKRKKMEIDLQESENRFRALYDANPAMFFTINRDNTIVSVNEFGAKKLGYCVNDLIGRSKMDIILSEDWENYRNNIEACFLDSKNTHNWEIRKVKNNGSIIWSRESARVVVDIDETQTLLIVSEDITEAHKLSQQLSYQASHDALTGLVNRREFEIRLESLIRESEGSGEEHALCYLDLDQFKVINDTCGHLAGDELLRQLGKLFHSKIRKKDTLARLGGDEFGVLMENCSLSQAQRVAESVRELVEEFQFVWTDKRFSIGISIGLVPIDDSSGNVVDILSAADASCYAAKDAGRNRVHIYHAEDIDMAIHRGQMQWVSKINHALEEDRFRLYLQPIISLSKEDEDTKHFECLIRMIDENGKIILPGAFLPAAERYDLSTKLDRWVFESVYIWLASRRGKNKKLTSCSINLSGHSLSNDAFLNFITGKLDEGKVLPSSICFEITETVAISRLSNAIRFIDKLKSKGCFFALDDFGSGVSSFGYLKNLPVDFLKIDGMFIRDMIYDPIDLEMVRSINEIGHVMGKKTIAEFVENKETLECLKGLGVDYAQGYHLGKPRAIKIPALKAVVRKTPKKKAKNKKRNVKTRKTD